MALAILDPTNGSIDAASGFVTAPRPVNLAGQTFGIMANGLGDSQIMFDALAARLAEADGVSNVVKVVKASVAVPPTPRSGIGSSPRPPWPSPGSEAVAAAAPGRCATP
jgi:hypothetical protein